MKRFKLPSPAMMVACIALAVALSGASYAAVALPRNSVGTKQLKRNAVSTAKIKPNAVTGAKLNEATLGQVPSAANAANAANAASAASAANADMLDGIDSTGYATAAQGVKGFFVFNDGTISQPFNAINTGGYVVVSNLAGDDTVGMPFPVTDRVMLVSVGASNIVGGTVPGCFAQVENVDTTTIHVEMRLHDGTACEEEWSLLIL